MLRPATCAALASLLLLACHDDPSLDGAGITVTVLSPQPETANLGILLAIHARGGQSLAVAVERGTFTSALDVPVDGGTAAAQTFQCFAASSGSNSNGLFSIELSVIPQESESLLFLTLYDSAKCQGTGVENRVVPVNKPGSNSSDGGAATIDAGGQDAP